MSSNHSLLLLFLFLALVAMRGAVAAGRESFNILQQESAATGKLGITLSNYCDSWKLNVELNNVRAFQNVPLECVDTVCNYMTTDQYPFDVQLATEECSLYLAFEFVLSGDEKDAWVFEIDDTLLSTLPFYAEHQYGGEKIDPALLEAWKAQGKAPAVTSMLNLYMKIKLMGLKIILISSRFERLRNATVDNLVEAGYQGWTKLILRPETPVYETIAKYKEAAKLKLVEEAGYRIWGVMGDQWSGLGGTPIAKRVFKLPNPMYYEV